MSSTVSKRLKFYAISEFKHKSSKTILTVLPKKDSVRLASMKRACESEFQTDLQYLLNFAENYANHTNRTNCFPQINNQVANYSTLNSPFSTNPGLATGNTPNLYQNGDTNTSHGHVIVGKHPQFNQMVLSDDNVLNFFEIRARHLKAKETSSYTQNNGMFTCHLLLKGDNQNYTTMGVSNTKKGAKRDAVRKVIYQLGPPTINECYEMTKWMVMGFIANYRINILSNRKFFKDGMHCYALECGYSHTPSGTQVHKNLGPVTNQSQVCTLMGYGADQIEAETDALQRLYIYVRNSIPKPVAEPIAANAKKSKTEDTAVPNNNIPLGASMSKYDIGNINYIKSAIVAKWQIKQTEDVTADGGKFSCRLEWDWMDFNNQHQKKTIFGWGSSKAEARASAGLKMLSHIGLLQELSPEDLKRAGEIREAISKSPDSLIVKCTDLLCNSSTSLWLFFLLDVFKYGIYKFDRHKFDQLINGILEACGAEHFNNDKKKKNTICAGKWAQDIEHSDGPIYTEFNQLNRGINGTGLTGNDASSAKRQCYTKFIRPDLWHDLIDIIQYLADAKHFELCMHLLNRMAEIPLDCAFFISKEAAFYFKKHRILLALEYSTGLHNGLVNKSAQMSDTLFGKVVSIQPTVVIVSGDYILDCRDKLAYREDSVIALSQDTADSSDPNNYFMLGLVTAFKVENYKYTINFRVLFDSISNSGTLSLDSISCKLVDLGSCVPNKRMVEALRSFTFNKSFNFKSPMHHRYSPFLQNLIINSYSPFGADNSVIINRSSGIHDDLVKSMNLNPAQAQACRSAIENELTLIQGPPGTGKTHLACSIIQCWSKIYSFDKILAVADSNIAADNLLQGLADRNIFAIRIGQGSEHELQEKAIQGMRRYSEYTNLRDSGRFKEALTLKTQMISEAVKRARIVIATCVGCGNEILSCETFTKVIIDECAQSIECSNIIPLTRSCNQLVLVGDHKQLRPTILSQEAMLNGLSVSILERLARFAPACVHLLNVQRRMHPSISQFPNQQFYESRLSDGDNVFSYTTLKGFKWPCENFNVCFIDVSIGCAGSNFEKSQGQSKYNLVETSVVAAVLGSFISANEISSRQIGILTPYDSQKYHLKYKITSAFTSDVCNGLEIDSVDGFQGKEKDLIIFSAVRSNNENSVGFLKDSRRMNVMLTRAKRGIVVVGDRFTLMNETANWGPWLQFLSDRNSIIRIIDLKDHLDFPNQQLMDDVDLNFNRRNQINGY